MIFLSSRGALVGIVLAVAVAVMTPLAAQAQTGTMFVKGDKVGVGTADPSLKLHVSGTAVDGLEFLVESTNPPGFKFTNGSSGNSVFFRSNSFDTFTISHAGTGGEEVRIQRSGRVIMGPGGFQAFDLRENGNLIIAGSLTQGSSRAIKDNVTAVDGRQILRQVAALPLSSWTYKSDSGVLHLGPMAEDFHSLFGLGGDAQHLAPGDAAGVALAAIQGLDTEIQERDARIRDLERELAELKAVVNRLVSTGR